MADQTTTTQKIQIGVETTPGTLVAATKRLLSVSLSLGAQGEIDTFRPSGLKYPALAVMGKEWSGGDLEGKPTYTELLYIISNMLGAPTTTTPGGGTTSRQHVWPIRTDAANTPKTWSVEKGNATQARAAAFGIITELGMTINRSEANLDGAFMARIMNSGATLTSLGGGAELALVPLLPKDTSVYLDSTAGAIGTTKLLRALEASWNLGDFYNGLWPLNAAEASFAAVYEGVPSSEVGLTLGADSVGYGLLTPMRAGDTRYLRLETISTSMIEGAIPWKFVADLAVKVTDVPDESDDDGLETLEYGFELVHDSTFGNAGSFTLVNNIAAL